VWAVPKLKWASTEQSPSRIVSSGDLLPTFCKQGGWSARWLHSLAGNLDLYG
jgi:hypothetical protein